MPDHLPIIQAWLAGRGEQVQQIAADTTATDPNYDAYRVMALSYEIESGKRPLIDITDACASATRSPPEDPVLWLFVLRAATYLAVYEDRLEDAQGFLEQMQRAAKRSRDPLLTQLTNQVRFVVARGRDDYPGQLAVLNESLSKVEDPQGIGAVHVRVRRFQSAIENHDLPLAEADLEAIRPHRQTITQHQIMALPLFEAVLLQTSGDHRAAMQVLRGMSDEDRDSGQGLALSFEAESLIHLSRMDEAEALVSGMVAQSKPGPAESYSRHTVPQAMIRYLQALAALGRGEAESAWTLADGLMKAVPREHPRWQHLARGIVIESLLAQRNTTLARRLLTRIDPDQARLPFKAAWVRLHWLSGDEDAAARVFAGLLNDTRAHPSYPASQLRFAIELSAADTTRLHRIAGALDGTMPMTSTQDAAQANGNNTLARRDRILELFRIHRRLTRAQIIGMIGCAPNTATRDLAALASEGRIKRHNTSAHPRTAYFTGPITTKKKNPAAHETSVS